MTRPFTSVSVSRSEAGAHGLRWARAVAAVAACTLLLLAGACSHGDATYTCTFEATTATGVISEEGFYGQDSLSCRDHCRVGDQAFSGLAESCRNQYDSGIVYTCDCSVELSSSCARWLSGRTCND